MDEYDDEVYRVNHDELNSIQLTVVEFSFDSGTPIWVVFDAVAEYFEDLDIPDADIYQSSTSVGDYEQLVLTIIYAR